MKGLLSAWLNYVKGLSKKLCWDPEVGCAMWVCAYFIMFAFLDMQLVCLSFVFYWSRWQSVTDLFMHTIFFFFWSTCLIIQLWRKCRVFVFFKCCLQVLMSFSKLWCSQLKKNIDFSGLVFLWHLVEASSLSKWDRKTIGTSFT